MSVVICNAVWHMAVSYEEVRYCTPAYWYKNHVIILENNTNMTYRCYRHDKMCADDLQF